MPVQIFSDRDYLMYRHGDHIECSKGNGLYLEGPAMSNDLTIIYPCNHGHCNQTCKCHFCGFTRKNLCSLKKHKWHLGKFEIKCPVQQNSQCQEHWIGHPDNFNEEEDILVEKSILPKQ